MILSKKSFTIFRIYLRFGLVAFYTFPKSKCLFVHTCDNVTCDMWIVCENHSNSLFWSVMHLWPQPEKNLTPLSINIHILPHYSYHFYSFRYFLFYNRFRKLDYVSIRILGDIHSLRFPLLPKMPHLYANKLKKL